MLSNYKTAIERLNQLQTNGEYLKEAILKEKSSNASKSLEKTIYFLSLLDIKPEDLNQLNVIHVAGTKGKGSTCAFIESILRKNGFKTGFYSSPHLVAARERIRINGESISEETFANYFEEVYNRISQLKNDQSGMPAYFNFLTVMAFYVFLKEKVDVAILEVGIGGLYDCTNVVPKPIVTGITSLDYDHCKLLGDTIDQIAFQKSGIFKENVTAFTVPQVDDAVKVLHDQAYQVRCPLYFVPSWSLYPGSSTVKLGINGEVQKLNASLAVQMARFWMSNLVSSHKSVPNFSTMNGLVADVIPLSLDHFGSALESTKWLGRCEVIQQTNKIIYFLDSAHTQDSMKNCCEWFIDESQKFSNLSNSSNFGFRQFHENFQNENNSMNKLIKILVFNCTGERDAQTLLTKLKNVKFDYVIFTTNRVQSHQTLDKDNSNLKVTLQQELKFCNKISSIWMMMHPNAITMQESSISNTIDSIENLAKKHDDHSIHILVCGSLHLVGGFISLIHPFYNQSNH